MTSETSYDDAEDLSEDKLFIKDGRNDRGNEDEDMEAREREEESNVENDEIDESNDESEGDAEEEGESLSDNDIDEGLTFKDEKDVVEPLTAGKEYLPGYLQVWRYATFPQTWTWRKRKFWNRTAEYYPQHLIQQHYKAFADDFNALYQLRYRPFNDIDVETRAVMLEDVSRHRNPHLSDCLINRRFSSVCTQI